MKKLLLPLTLSLCSFQLYADSYNLQDIHHTQEETSRVEEASDTQFKIDNEEVVSQTQINELNSASSSIDDVLRLSTSATTARGPRSSGETPQVRGLDSNKIFVKIDGARQNFKSGHRSMISIDLENLKAVDISKSPSDISNTGSIGGGVNFVTKDAEDILSKGYSAGSEFKLQSNSANRERILHAKTALRDKFKSTYLSVTKADAGDLGLSNGETLANSAYDDFAVLLKSKYKNFSFKVEHMLRLDNVPTDPSLNPPSNLVSLLSDNETKKQNISLGYSTSDVSLLAYYNLYEQQKTNREDSETKIRDLKTRGAKFSQKIKNWRVGFEGYRDELDSTFDGEEILSYPKAYSENYSAFVEKNTNLNKNILLNTGLRTQSYYMKSYSDMPTKSADALSKNLKISHIQGKFHSFISYSEGFNAPRVNEVYPSGLHSQGDNFILRDNFFIPNEQLEAELSQAFELGSSFVSDIFSAEALLELRANIHETHVKNYIALERIDRSTADSEDGTTQFINIPKAKLYGLELEANLMYKDFDFKLTHSMIRGRNQTDDLYLEDLPSDQVNFQVKYFLEKEKLTLGLLSHLALRQDRVNPGTTQRTDPTGEYLIHNLFVTKSFKAIDLNLRIDNLTDKEYRKHASNLFESERDIKLSIKYKVNTI